MLEWGKCLMNVSGIEQVTLRYEGCRGASVTPACSGLINDTYLLGDKLVLQRLHPVFDPAVNLDIAALAPLLLAGGVPVPTLVPATDGALWIEIAEGSAAGVWRALTRLPGRTLHRVERPAQARAGGRMLARFHAALLESDHVFAFERPGAHDTPMYMTKLVSALERMGDHRLHDSVSRLAEGLLLAWETWGRTPDLPARIIHGDPKISNLLFSDTDGVTGVIDLDTMARSGVDVEIGDALRSWCSTGDESCAQPVFDLTVFREAVCGYLEAAAPWITTEEIEAIPCAVEHISLELAARFAVDALEETYFGWDPSVAPTRGDHNLIRAQNQVALARCARGVRTRMEDIVAAVATAAAPRDGGA